MGTITETTFTYLDSMSKGCSYLIQLMDDFNNYINSLAEPITVENYDWNNVPVLYKDYYAKRKVIYVCVVAYIEDYFSSGENLAKYKEAVLTLQEIEIFFGVLTGTQSLDIFSTEFKTATTNRVSSWQLSLAQDLRDLIKKEMNSVIVSNTDDKKSGSKVSTSVPVTTNASAAAYYSAAKVRAVDPVVKRNISDIRSEDIHKAAEENIKAKQQEGVEQQGVLNKLANGAYLSDVVKKFEKEARSFLIQSNIGNFVLTNLVCNNTLSTTSLDPISDAVAQEARVRTRKKFGNLGFCDEVSDGKGGWVLKNDAESKAQLEKARTDIRNKMLAKLQ